MTAEQTIHLEAYEPQVRAAFGRAQTLADERKHVTVTWHHLVHVILDHGWAREPCVRASVDPESLLAQVKTVLAAFPQTAREPSYLDSPLLAVMKASEGHAAKLGRPAVDFQCVFVALGEKEYVPHAIGAGDWSVDERTGRTRPVAPSFESALATSAKALDGLADRIASALGTSRPPPDVARTLQKIRAQFYPPNEIAELMVERHDGCLLIGREGKSEDNPIVLQWAPPTAIEIVVPTVSPDGDKRVAEQFELVKDTNTWRSAAGRDLFEAVRDAIVALYPEANRPPN